jgi:membrane-associated protease RseP (regulator of RpoE activity)
MLLLEPPRTAYDIHFQVAGIPVRIHPLFWLATLILGTSGSWGADGGVDPQAGMRLLIWTGAVLGSILAHELGHATLMRRFGEDPRVVLYMLGGLAVSDGAARFRAGFGGRRSAREQFLISLAGPGAGFLLAALTVLLLLAMGGGFQIDLAGFPIFFRYEMPPGSAMPFTMLIGDLLFINIFWGLINLLPVLPLDGGQAARVLFEVADPWNGTGRCLWLSVITGGAVAVAAGFYLQDLFLALLFGSLAVSSYLTLQQIGGGGFGGRPW